MFFAVGSNFCYYLQCFLLLEAIFAAIYNVFCSWKQFLVLFTMFFALHVHFCCYLQCFVISKVIFDAIYNVFCSSCAFGAIYNVL